MKRFFNMLGVVGAMTVCGSAYAGTIVATFDSVSPGKTLKYVLGGQNDQSLAGVFNWTRTSGTHGNEISGAFDTFCIELTQSVGYGAGRTYNVIPLELGPTPGNPFSGGGMGMGSAKADNVRKLWAAYYDDALLSENNAAAFQTAIWEIVHDTGLDLRNGDFQARIKNNGQFENGFVSTAVTWLGSLSNLTAKANLVALSSPTLQDQVTVVPEPASLSMLAVGSLLMARRRRA